MRPYFSLKRLLKYQPGLERKTIFNYHKVASSRSVYYSIFELFDQRSQYISINFPLISLLKILGCATDQDSLLIATLRQVYCNGKQAVQYLKKRQVTVKIKAFLGRCKQNACTVNLHAGACLYQQHTQGFSDC